jgi:phage terminase large subunit
MRDFREIVVKNGWWNPGWVERRRKYELWGNEVRFMSIDQAYKLRGRKRHVLFLNEANRFPYDAWQQLFMRTTDRIIMDWNPDAEDFWGYELVDNRDDATLYRSSYKDNPFLPQTTIEAIESLKDHDPWYWQVFGLGERAANPAVIYRRWEVVKALPEALEDDQGRSRAPKFIGAGCDFGFSADPSAVVLIWDGLDGELYCEEIVYETRLTNPELAERILAELDKRGLPANADVICDSAEPKSIEEMRRAKVNARPCHKGADSIRQGIQIVQQFKLHLIGSENLQKELRSYRWSSDGAGRLTSKPVGGNDHAADALRYVVSWAKHSRFTGEYAIGSMRRNR